jgi:hypothetical protein
VIEMSKPAEMFPKLTRAERSAMNKAAQAAHHEARKAARAERAAAKAAEIAQAHAEARARATEMIDVSQVPRNAAEVRQVCKALTPGMLQILVEIATNPMQQAAGRVAAAQVIIERGHGKAVQPITGAPGDVFDEMDDDALDMYLLKNTSLFIEGKVNDDVQRGHEIQPRADTGRTAGDTAAQDSRPAGGARHAKGKRVGKPNGKRSSQK